MEILLYSAKSAGILALFYGVYYFALRKETLFTANRHFLLGGILTALVLPALTFTKTIYLPTPSINDTAFSNLVFTTQTIQETETIAINWWQMLLIFYVIGCAIMIIRLLIQLFSLLKLLSSNTSEKKGNYIYSKVTDKIAPFSFFKYIVYNPSLHTQAELEMILQHEKIHATQWHSIDILLAHVCRALQWANPFAWFYKKSIEANLEFIADSETAAQVTSIKAYQLALVKASSSLPVPALTNNFYHSFIKKRIIMLNKSNSKSNNTWKLSFILPLLAVFLWSFNVTEEIKYIPENISEINTEINVETPLLQFDATSSETELNAIETYFSENYPESRVRIADRKRDAKGNLINFSFQTKFKKDTRFYTRFDRGADAPFKTIYKIEPQEGGVLLVSEIGENSVQFKITQKNLQFSSTEKFTVPSEEKRKTSVNAVKAAVKRNGNSAASTSVITTIQLAKPDLENGGSYFQKEKIKKKITKNTTEAELEAMKNSLKKEYGVDIKFSTVRNKANEITSIKIFYNWDGEKGIFNISNTGGISDSYLYLDKENGQYGFHSEDSKHLDTSLLETRNSLNETRKELLAEVRALRTERLEESNEMREEMLKERKELLSEAKSDGSEFMELRKKMLEERKALLEQRYKLQEERKYFQNKISENETERSRTNLTTHNSQATQPIYVVDGVIKTNGIAAIENDQIKTVHILKGDTAIDKYGDKAKNGVVEITLYKLGERITNQGNPLTQASVKTMLDRKGILILKDGKEITKQAFKKINPSNIISIFTIESEKAIEKFGKKASNGAIVITTKEK